MLGRMGVGRLVIRGPWGWFLAWSAVGAGLALSLLGAATIGVFTVPVTVAAAVLLAKRPDTGPGLPGVASGAAVPLLYVAYLNRMGPGTVCTVVRGGGQSCVDQWSPWPWAAAGAAVFVAGIVIFAGRRKDPGAASDGRPSTG